MRSWMNGRGCRGDNGPWTIGYGRMVRFRFARIMSKPMKNWNAVKERFMSDPLPIRLGNLAANLSRIKSFSSNEASRDTVASLIEESKMFIEWTAAQAEIEVAAKLVELQIQLALWQLQWQSIWTDPKKRSQVAEQSSMWSKQVLELSGLLK